jgi:hypothetical protein
VAARDPAALPPALPTLSLYTDADDREWARLDAQAAEVLRLDALLKARDDANAALASAQQAAKALRDEIERLERAIAAQERIIAYRQSARWWVLLPWMRVRTWLRGTRP